MTSVGEEKRYETSDPVRAAASTKTTEPLDGTGEKDVIEVTSSHDGESEDKEDNGKRPALETQNSYATTGSNVEVVKAKPWYKQLNPLRWGAIPPVPSQREFSHEHGAGFFSLLTFQWMRPLMTVGYKRQLQPSDIWLVNPSRTADLMVTKLQTSFDMRVARGDKYPLLWALHETFKKEFWIGGICQLFANVFQVSYSQDPI